MPFLLAGLAVGLVVSVFQAVTSIQEQTLTFIPKILVTGAVLGGRRTGVPVVESGGEIVWVAEVATSERFRVTAATREAVRGQLPRT